MIFNKIAEYMVKKSLKKSGQLEELGRSYTEYLANKNSGQAKSYRQFEDLFYDITVSLNYKPKEQKQFFFDFQFILLTSIWSSLSFEEAEKIKLIAMDFYGLKMSEIKSRIELLRQSLSKFKLNKKDTLQIESFIELLDDTHKVFVDGDDYTFTEAISSMPEELYYPENLALKILEYLGHTRENTFRNY